MRSAIPSLERKSLRQERTVRGRHMGGVLAAALMARLAVVWYVMTRLPAGWLYTRGQEMGLLAMALLDGRGLSDPYGARTGPTASIAPGYPVFLAAMFRLFGTETRVATLAILLVQVGINLVTVCLLLRVARRFAAEWAAVFVALLWGCSLATIWMPAILWETSFSALFLLAAAGWALDLASGGRGQWAAGGAGCALAGLMNPALLPSLAVLGALAVWRRCAGRRPRLTGPMLGLVVFAALYAPWPVRNARVFHTLILTRRVAGFNLWVGNRPGATGYLDESVFPTFNAGELAAYRAEGEVAYDARKTLLARQAIRERPGRFLGLTAGRTVRFWTGTGSEHGSILFAWHGVTTLLLGLIGAVLLFRSGRRFEVSCFAVPLLLFSVPYTITHAEFRYRLVVDPLLCGLGGVALEHLVRTTLRHTAVSRKSRQAMRTARA